MSITDQVLIVLDENGGQVEGIFHLGYRMIGTQDISWLRRCLRKLEAAGQVEVVDNGIPKPKSIIKRNRNSPGYPRKARP